MTEILTAKIRQERGSNAIRHLRRAGYVPAVLYGHGQENVVLSLRSEQISPVIHHGTKLVDLQGDVRESALIREVQWDTFGNEVLHVDFTRVSAGESVETKLSIALKGEAPGARSGGIVEHVLHEIEIECPVSSLPDRIDVNINALELGQSILAGDVPMPAGARLLTDPEQVVVHCIEAGELGDEEVTEAESDEPEVVGGRKSDDEDEEGES
jgi:large subunit ribosomal protein L25